MRYQMKQKGVSLGDNFVIRDEKNREVFLINSKLLSLGHKLYFRDMKGNELAYIEQKLLSLGPTYEIYRNGRLAAIVKKELFSFAKCVFHVDVPGPDDLTATGTFLSYDYVFTRGDQTVAAVSQVLAWTDTYAVEVRPGEDDILILASTVVIDMVCNAYER